VSSPQPNWTRRTEVVADALKGRPLAAVVQAVAVIAIARVERSCSTARAMSSISWH
jgi:hypothetical protein